MITVFTDGASRGNPGRASYGFACYKSQDRTPFYTESMYLGIKTNNEAEYIALYRALRKLREDGYGQIRCFLDSELIVKQMQGKYKVKKPELKEIADAIRVLIADAQVTFTHVPRADNALADELANYALDHASTPGTTFKNLFVSAT